MDTNKMLKAFIRTYRSLLIAEGMNVQESRFELRDGVFVHRETAVAWWSWQASRAAVVVQMPNRAAEAYREEFDDVEGGCFNEAAYISDVRKAIEAQGLKVAP
ncbi:hypothetical protein OZ911_18155 [Pseudomonas fortuita]|uniref:Uncharacterized protein n=1 Tax=Pseudomonas fortuita TaxID=3233375 RepID=A0ACD4P1D6_9PSED|nr:hypothetical protein [Pseudomonas putida]WAP61841.1 hypothetical protein OZ911_18155 [Pseudomonas putida]